MDVASCERWDANESGRQAGIACGNVGMTFEGQLVSVLSFSPSMPLAVGDVIDKCGDPDSADIATLGISMTPPLAMGLNFDGERMTLGLPEQDSTEYAVKASTEVESIAYFDDARYAFHTRGSDEWAGYGVY